MTCPNLKPRCDYPGRQPTKAVDKPINPGGTCKQYQGACAKGTKCYQNRCTDVIPAGEICSLAKICKNEVCRARNICEEGYVCSNQRCRVRSNDIAVSGSCQEGELCKDGTRCIRNVCTNLTPIGGSCQRSDWCESRLCSRGRCVEGCNYRKVCDSGYTCLQGVCTLPAVSTASKWYTSNDQFCITECLSKTSILCKDIAQPWDHVYTSVEDCCIQSSFQGTYYQCLSKSLQYSGGIET